MLSIHMFRWKLIFGKYFPHLMVFGVIEIVGLLENNSQLTVKYRHFRCKILYAFIFSCNINFTHL